MVLALIRGRAAAPTEVLEVRWPGAKLLLGAALKASVLGGALGTVLGSVGCAVAANSKINREILRLSAEVFGSAGAVAFGLAGGIGAVIAARAAGVRSSPNLALSRSFRSAITCFVAAVLFSVPFLLLREFWLPQELQDSDSILWNVLVGGEFFAWMGLFIALEYGGYFLLDHFLTRYLLRRKRLLPWDLVRFLDTAAERILLRKVGGGYIFVHRTLLEYFAKESK
jgi:hypothetical protein